MSIKVIATEEYLNWHAELTLKEQMQVDSRVARIEQFGHFGDVKNLGDGLAELRWNSG